MNYEPFDLYNDKAAVNLITAALFFLFPSCTGRAISNTSRLSFSAVKKRSLNVQISPAQAQPHENPSLQLLHIYPTILKPFHAF